MTASIRIRDAASTITEMDMCLDHGNEGAAEPCIWLDTHIDSDKARRVEDDDVVDIVIDHIPTLHDIYEPSFVSDSHDVEQTGEIVSRGDDLPEVQPPSLVLAMDGDADIPVKVEAPGPDQYGDSSHASLQDVFNLTRYEPAQLQRALMVLACVFQVIAAAALWRAVGDRVIVTALVPPLVYASIGVVAYLLGMRYLRIHFAQVRVGDKDWLLCEQVMVAADNGVMLKARFGTAYLIWEQLLGVAQDNDYYYLLIEPSQGFKVPKQGVSDPMLKTKLDDLASLTKAKALQDNR